MKKPTILEDSEENVSDEENEEIQSKFIFFKQKNQNQNLLMIWQCQATAQLLKKRPFKPLYQRLKQRPKKVKVSKRKKTEKLILRFETARTKPPISTNIGWFTRVGWTISNE